MKEMTAAKLFWIWLIIHTVCFASAWFYINDKQHVWHAIETSAASFNHSARTWVVALGVLSPIGNVFSLVEHKMLFRNRSYRFKLAVFYAYAIPALGGLLYTEIITWQKIADHGYVKCRAHQAIGLKWIYPYYRDPRMCN